MLPAKFLLAAVSLGLAVTAPDVSGSRLRVRVHSKSTTTCADGEQTIGVAGWDHDGCIASDNICVAQVSDGDCPDGAHCALLDTGVYGCTAGDDDSSDSEETTSYCADGEQTIGVAGWDHDGCIASDNVCVAQVSDGDCPDGAYCALLDTGVYGCTAGYPEDTSYVDDGNCDENEQTIGVVGWDHDGCIDSDYVCVAQVSDGDCPAGAYCSLLDTGVYGCVAEAKHQKHHHHHKSNQKVTCPSGQQSIGVAGWSQDGCVASGNVCVANTYGSCPSGAHCAWLDTGVYGCMDGADESTPWEGCASNEDTIGVVGWDHDGCIDSDYVCVAQVSDGDCPAGTYCSLLDTGVYGCVAEAKHKKHHHHHKSNQKVTCPSGQQSIGVAGWSQDGCVASGNVCVANTYGSCPSGAHCAWLDTGVYGCMDGADESTPWEGCASNEDTIGVVGWDHDGCIDSDYVCVAQVSDGDCPAGTYCSLLDTGVYGCVAEAKHKKHHHHHKSNQKVTCPSGQQSIGVAGWSQDGCVASGNVCVANTYGSCPSGAHCAWLDTGVYGCMDGADESTPWEGCASNEDTIGVVGWDHDGCIDSDYVCVAQVSDGDCPAGTYCSLLDTGVYGCVAEAKHKKHHHHHKSNQKVTCPSGQQSIGVAGWSQDGCVASGNVCVANTYGSCPSGAHCAWLDTGVYGCMDGADESTPWEGCASNEDTIGVVGWDHDGCIDSDYVCVAQVSDGDCPAGTYCSLLDTGVYGCVAEAKHKKHHHHHKSNQKVTCPSGQQSIGVAGWSQDGCVASGNVCVANTYGSCPSGAHCAWLDTGVYGCMDGADESTPWEGCASNEDTIGVVGWDHDGCIDSDYVCVAQVSDGDCPAGTYCSLLDTGVYGCVAEAKHQKHHHHKKHHN